MKTTLFASLALAAIATTASAQDDTKLALGKTLAQANCADCHNVEPGGAMKLFPPSFTAIATYMHPEIIPIRIMYPDAHKLMPNFGAILNADSLDAVTSYILSLEE